jgi:hypothetical protein
MNANLEKIRSAVAIEAARCVEEKDAHGGAELMQVLVTGLGLSISSLARGDTKVANDFAEAASQLLMDEVIHFKPLSVFLSRGAP